MCKNTFNDKYFKRIKHLTTLIVMTIGISLCNSMYVKADTSYELGDGVSADYNSSTDTLTISGDGEVDKDLWQTMSDEIKTSVKSVSIQDSTVSLPEDSSRLFKGWTSLTTLDLSKLDMSNVTNAASMLANCSELRIVKTPSKNASVDITINDGSIDYKNCTDTDDDTLYNSFGDSFIGSKELKRVVHYTVEHYKGTSKGNYTLDSDATENLYDIYDTEVTPPVKTYDEFTSPETQTVTLDPNADSPIVVKYYYAAIIKSTVSIYYGGGEYNGSLYVKYTMTCDTDDNNDLSSEIPTKTGYTFGGFYIGIDDGDGEEEKIFIYDSEGKITNDGTYWKDGKWVYTEDVELSTQWDASTNIKYTVNHWQQNIGGNPDSSDSSNYTLVETETFTGTADDTAIPDVKEYTGFTSPSVQVLAISADGTTVIDYYYTRDTYKLTVNPNGGTWGGTTETTDFELEYGETKTIANPSRSGYNFNRWSVSGDNSSISSLKFTMGSEDATLKASWSAETTNKTVLNQTTAGSGTYTAEYSGIYQIELYGASGGGASGSNKSQGGYGGYITAKIKVKKGTVFDWESGAQGSKNGSSSYGQGGSASNGGYSGGGYSRVMIGSTPILVAGGGGGRSGKSVPSPRYVTSNTLAGFGGGTEQGSIGDIVGMHTKVPGDIYGHQHSTNGETQWKGGSATNGAGGGGGGYFAGTAGDAYYAGGGGGTSYYYSGADYSVYDVSEMYGMNIGSGMVKITYIGSYDVTVTIVLNNNGTISGVQNKIAYQVELTKSCDTTITIPSVTTKDKTIEFTGYTQTLGDGTITDNGDGTYTINSGMEGVTIQANYTSTGISFSQTQDGDKVKLEWYDTAAKFYVLRSGVDISSTNVAEDFDTENSELLYEVTDSDKTITSTYTVKASGYYLVQLWGGKGGSSTHNGSSLGSHSTGVAAGGNGTYVTAKVYLKKGDVLKKVTYSGGGSAYGQNSGCRSGVGGTGVGLVLNNSTTILAAGGGGGGTTCTKCGDGETHGNAFTGSTTVIALSSSTTGANGYRYARGTEEGTWYSGIGGSGGGYPKGGNHKSNGEFGSAGQSYTPSKINGKAVKESSIKCGVNGSTSTTVKIKMCEIAGGTEQTSGTYQLKDKKAPYTPEAAAIPYKEDSSVGNGTYIVYWQETTDQASVNMYQVTSYNSDGEELHTSAVYSVEYASGVKEYLVSTNGKNYKSVGTDLQYSGLKSGQTLYIKAKDNAGNISGVLEITIPGDMTISYNLNNTTNNVNGMPYSYQATGSIPGTMIKADQSAIVAYNNGEMLRTGYYHTYDSTTLQQVWIGSDGQTYHSGDEITYVAGKTLILYAQWTPITYTVNLHQNRPTDTTRGTDQIGAHTVNNIAASSLGWKLVSTDEADIYYTKTFTFDSTILEGPSSIFSLTGWSLDTNTKWYETIGDNGSASGTSHEAFNKAQYNNLTSEDGKVFNFYPKWTKNTYTIKYDYNKGTKNIFGDTYTTSPNETNYSVASTSCTYDTDVTITDKQYTREGYTFVGWSTDKDWGTGQTKLDTWNTTRNSNQVKSNYHDTYAYSSKDLFVSGQKIFKPNFKDGTSGNTEIIFYAIWEPITYTVKFDSNKGTENKMSDMIVRYDQSIALNPLDIIRKYTITYMNAEPWLTDLKSQNGTTNTGYNTSVTYSFIGWSQTNAIGSTPYYEFTGTVTGLSSATGTSSKTTGVTTANNYQVTSFTSSKATLLNDKATIKNLYGGIRNDPTKNIVTLYATWKGNTTKIAGTVPGEDDYIFVDWSDTPYVDERLYDEKINDNKDDVDAPVGSGEDYKPYKDTIFYAHWKKTANLVFNLDGGIYKDATSKITTKGVYYDYDGGYTFGILNNMTKQYKGHYDTQTVVIDSNKASKLVTKVDAYATYDSNGINTSYIRVNGNTGDIYRLLGWSYSYDDSIKEAAVPATDEVALGTPTKGNYVVYDLENHTKQVRITDTTNLYAVWEPILQLDFDIERDLGSINTLDMNKKSAITSVTTLTDRTVSLTINPGEQATYSIVVPYELSKLTTTKPIVTVEFDKDASGNTYSKDDGLSLQAIYDDATAKWYDTLNPNTTEDLTDDQSNGLDRTFDIDDEKQEESRVFYIPQYLGTSQSYNAANKGQASYHAVVTVSKPSYYWKYWSTTSKPDGTTQETLNIDCLITLKEYKDSTPSSGTGSDTDPDSNPSTDPSTTEGSELNSILSDIKTQIR